MLGPIVLTLAMAVLLLAAGVWVGVGLGLSGVFGLGQVLGLERTLDIVGKIVWEQNTNFVLLAIPMFIFMGELLFQSGIMSKVYLRAATVVTGLPGGLLQANIFACTIFAACSGSSVASAATIGSVGYPEISKRGYNTPIALGSIAAGGTLGILIPPSIIFIIYGSLADVSVGKLFLAGLFPGLGLAALFSLYIGVRCLLNRGLAPRVDRSSMIDRLRALAGLWEMAVLVVVVLGGIYAGVASPTEVAALGASLALLFSMGSGRFSLAMVWRAGLATVRQTSMILFIIFTAKILSMTLIYFRVPSAVVAWVDTHDLTFAHIFLAVAAIYLLLGMFIEGIAMMVLTIPFIVPVMAVANMDPVWMGVVICILIEVGLLTPPVGLNLFVLQGVTKEPIHDVIIGTMPFLIIQFLMIAALYYWPEIALFLPRLVMG
ncbi:MAG: TRAP transporter large permease [Rhodospirillales bacterium]|nr:TRAP transporter large permease [Rhodospirillales bacterium]